MSIYNRMQYLLNPSPSIIVNCLNSEIAKWAYLHSGLALQWDRYNNPLNNERAFGGFRTYPVGKYIDE